MQHWLSFQWVRRSLCSSERPNALGTNATTSYPTERITPAPVALALTTSPTAGEAFALARPISRLICTPSEARSSTNIVLSAPASTLLTTNTAPAADRIAGTASEAPAPAPAATDASGRADNALTADASVWARAGTAMSAPSDRTAVRRCFFSMETSWRWLNMQPVWRAARERSHYSARLHPRGAVGISRGYLCGKQLRDLIAQDF